MNSYKRCFLCQHDKKVLTKQSFVKLKDRILNKEIMPILAEESGCQDCWICIKK